MRTVAAAYGYLGDGAPVEQWGADHVIHRPDDLLPLIRRQVVHQPIMLRDS
jgi:phosphoglycolate phosphatase